MAEPSEGTAAAMQPPTLIVPDGDGTNHSTIRRKSSAHMMLMRRDSMLHTAPTRPSSASNQRNRGPSSSDILNPLRQAAMVLSLDYALIHTLSYEKHWELLMNTLKSPEPALRLWTLKALLMIGAGSVPRTLISLGSRLRLLELLIEVAVSDELQENRHTACLYMGMIAHHYTDATTIAPPIQKTENDKPTEKSNNPNLNTASVNANQIISGLLDRAFDVILDQCSSFFPKQLELRPLPHSLLESMTQLQQLQPAIYLLRALSYFYSILQDKCHTQAFVDYFDRLTLHLLQSTIHPCLQAEALFALSRLPCTRLNRVRLLPGTALHDAVQALSRRDMHQHGSRRSALSLQVRRGLAAYWSVWYPLPSDPLLVQLPSLVPGAAGDVFGWFDLTNGYAARRRQLLMSHLQPKLIAGKSSAGRERNQSIIVGDEGLGSGSTAVAKSNSTRRAVSAHGQRATQSARQRMNLTAQADFGWVKRFKQVPLTWRLAARTQNSVNLPTVNFYQAPGKESSNSMANKYALFIHDNQLLQSAQILGPSVGHATASTALTLPEVEDTLAHVNIDSMLCSAATPFLIDPQWLSFNLPPGGIVFNRLQLSREVHIQNKSPYDLVFCLQVHPLSFFQVSPAYGHVPKESSVPVVVQFTPRPWDLSSFGHEVHGYLRVRTDSGFTLERLSLRAYNLPLLKISASSIDFGTCPPGHERKAIVTLNNLSATELSCTLHFKSSETSHFYHVSSYTVALSPRGKATVPITFTPLFEQASIQDTLLIVGMCGEAHRLHLHAQCYRALTIFDTKLDFGTTQVDTMPLLKTLVIQNRDPVQQLPVLIRTSSNEITVNGEQNILLHPLEKRKLTVAFSPVLSGMRLETIQLSAPNSGLESVQVVAQVGSSVFMPLLENIALPSVRFGESSQIQLPLVNATSQSVTVHVLLSSQEHFHVQPSSLDSPDSAKRGLVEAHELDESEQGAGKGYALTMAPQSTLLLTAKFNPQVANVCRAILSIQVVQPKRQAMITRNLFGLSLNDKLLKSNEITLLRSSIEKWTGMRQMQQLKSNSDRTVLSTQNVFEFDVPQLMIRLDDAGLCMASLTNVSPQSQKYHLLCTYPFVVRDMSMEGQVLPNRTVEIPIAFTYRAFEQRPDESTFAAVGCLTACDEHGLVMATCILYGIYQTPLYLDVRELAPSQGSDLLIRFPDAKLTDRLSRRLALYNRSPLEVAWEAKFSAAQVVETEDDAALQVMRREQAAGEEVTNPFTLAVTRGKLKAFEMSFLDVVMQPSRSGSFRTRLMLSYVADSQMERSMKSRVTPLRTLILECNAGRGEFEVTPNTLAFGDVLLQGMNKSKIKSIQLQSTYPIETQVAFMPPQPPFMMTNGKLFRIIPKQSKILVPIAFQPSQSQYYFSLFALCHMDKTFTVMMTGSSGTALIHADSVIPIEPPLPQLSHHALPNILDLGVIELGRAKVKRFRLFNRSSFDLLVTDMKSSDLACLQWQWVDPRTGQPLAHETNKFSEVHRLGLVPQVPAFEEGLQTLDANQVDWDELDAAVEPFTLPDKGAVVEEESAASNNAVPAVVNDHAAVLDVRAANQQRRRRSFVPSANSNNGYNNTSNAVANVPSANSIFPLRFAPDQYIDFCLSFGDGHLGAKQVQLRLETCSIEGESYPFVFQIQGNMQPPMTLHEMRLDFGTRAVHSRHMKTLQITNHGSVPLKWSIEMDELVYKKVGKYGNLVAVHRASLQRLLSTTISLFPMQGLLSPGCTQTVEVQFTPTLPQHQIQCRFLLQTEDFMPRFIHIQGIGASTVLQCSHNQLDFKCVRVGTVALSEKMVLSNRGVLPARFHCECSDPSLSIEPEQGLLDGDADVSLQVKYQPTSVAALIQAQVRIIVESQSATDKSSNHKPVVISVQGSGGYPELEVLTKVIDFGIALYGHANKRPIRIHNHGAAEAMLVFHCFHPHVTLERETDVIVIPANTIRDVNVVYTPLQVDDLNVKVFVRSQDIRGDYFVVLLRGTVGSPKLVFDPEQAMQQLDFGVIQVNGQQVEKQFSVTNQGNIPLHYQLLLQQPQVFGLNALESTEQDSDYPFPFTVQPKKGTLAVGQSVQVTLTFQPRRMVTTTCQLEFKYDFRSLCGLVSGTGGKAVMALLHPLRELDFGTCRISRVYRKEIVLTNGGNISYSFQVRPVLEEGPLDENLTEPWLHKDSVEIEDSSKTVTTTNVITNEGETATTTTEKQVILVEKWRASLLKKGLRLWNANGSCPPHQQSIITLLYEPQWTPLNVVLEVKSGDSCESITLKGHASATSLILIDPLGRKIETLEHEVTAVINTANNPLLFDLGVQPVQTEATAQFKLMNPCPFGIDYLVQPIGIPEFQVSPRRGFIASGHTVPLTVLFKPRTEDHYQVLLKILWEGKALCIRLAGMGGIGKLQVCYCDEHDVLNKSMDFGMVPLHTSSAKRFYLYNTGRVPVVFKMQLMETGGNGEMNVPEKESEYFQLGLVGSPFFVSPEDLYATLLGGVKLASKKTVWNWFQKMSLTLHSNYWIELEVKYHAKQSQHTHAMIQILAEGNNQSLPLIGKGGTMSLSYQGDLAFGDVATHYTYWRRLKIANAGTITANMNFEFQVVGQSGHASSYFSLEETYPHVDPRSGDLQKALLKDKGKTGMEVSDYWILLRRVILKRESIALAHHATMADIDEANTNNSNATNNPNNVNNINANNPMSKKPNTFAALSHHFKRRQILYRLISSQPVSSQSSSVVKPFLRVEPATALLTGHGEVEVKVELNAANEDIFLATLICRSNVPNTQPLEIALTATPKTVMVRCDDTSMLQFGRQPLGEAETLFRTFTNMGHKEIAFRVLNENQGLTVVPKQGLLGIEQSVKIAFIFKPMEETMQERDILFEPDCSQPIRLKMQGGGGFARISLAKYRRFDFGLCMIGKQTLSNLPIVNEGNATLHLVLFDIAESRTYFKGQDWPRDRMSLLPGKSFQLPIVFKPETENPPNGKVIVGTALEKWEIELVGAGREAVLIVSRPRVEFLECLIGNTYEEKLGLKNIGEVNYPVSFVLDEKIQDVHFVPNQLVIPPFTEQSVTIVYRPSRETKCEAPLNILSPYCSHLVPLHLHAGTATLEFSRSRLDFGFFEKSQRPTLTLSLRNIGTVRTSFLMKSTAKPSCLHIQQGKGMLLPRRVHEVQVQCQPSHTGTLEERLIIRTDLTDKVYTITAHGQCEEALVHPDEFRSLQLGVCPVYEVSMKKCPIRNYGLFPLTFEAKAVYPIKVQPQEGVIQGQQSLDLTVTWIPSGGYELRSSIHLHTNIGIFDITVRGKAALPELFIRNSKMDFGVCAVGYTYRKTLTLCNKGKVPIVWQIPTHREGFQVHPHRGKLQIKEEQPVEVQFQPMAMMKYVTNLIVEVKGMNFREVFLSGIGGSLKLEWSPVKVDLGDCACGFWQSAELNLTNRGDVALQVRLESDDESLTSATSNRFLFKSPASVLLRPNTSLSIPFQVLALSPGFFQGHCRVITSETHFPIELSGHGTRVLLDRSTKKLLIKERLDTCQIKDPLDELKIMQGLEVLLASYQRDWDRKWVKKLISLAQKLPVLVDDAKNENNIKAKEIQNESETIQNDIDWNEQVTVENENGIINESELESDLNPTNRVNDANPLPTKEVFQELPQENLIPIQAVTDLLNEEEMNENEKTGSSESLNSGRNDEKALEEQEKDSLEKDSLDDKDKDSLDDKEKDDEETLEESLDEKEKNSLTEEEPNSINEKVQLLEQEKQIIQSPSVSDDDEIIPKDIASTLTRDSLEKMYQIYSLDSSTLNHDNFQYLKHSFYTLKQLESHSHHVPNLDSDPLIHSLLSHPYCHVESLDLDPILYPDEMDLDVDLSLLLKRPPPVLDSLEEASQTTLHSKYPLKMTKVYLPLERRKRNAPTVDSFKK